MTKDEQIYILQRELNEWRETGQLALNSMTWVGDSYLKGFYPVEFATAVDKIRELLLKIEEST